MILCSGGPGCCDYLEPVAAMVDDLLHVYRFDPRGCGRSSEVGPYDLTTAVSDLEAIRVALGETSWIVGGHSWGATLALAYALRHPARTVAIAYISGAGIQNDRDWHAAYHEGRNAGREKEMAFAYPPNLEVNRAVNASTNAFIKEPPLLRRLAEIETPMLAVSGSGDIRPIWPVEQLCQLMPNARLEMIEGADHYIWITHPDELRSHLRHFASEYGSRH